MNNRTEKIILKEIDFINSLNKNLYPNKLDEVAKLIYEYEKIFCVASRNIHACALWLGMSLDKIKGDTFYSEIEGEKYYSNLMSIDEKSLIIVISFSRYSILSYNFSKSAKKRGAHILSITDSKVSPIAQIADNTLLVNSKVSDSGFNSIGPTMVLFDLIIGKYLELYPKEASKRLKELEKMYKEKEDLYFE